MKRFFAIILALAASLFAISCTSSANPTPTPPPPAPIEVVVEASATPIPPTKPPTATATETEEPTPSPTGTKRPPTSTATPTSSPTSSPTSTSSPTPPPPSPLPTQTPGGEGQPQANGDAEESPPTSTPDPCPGDGSCLPTPVATPAALAETENILLIGTDLRPSQGAWRTDTLLLAAIDWDNQRVGVVSFPRDYWARLPYPPYERRKINTLDFLGENYKYEGGGFGMLRDVFMQNFGVRIDHFARLHRRGFVEIVDSLGGVEVTLDCDLWEISPKEDGTEDYYVLYLPAGSQKLDGDTSLDFATYRYRTGDWDRARRQQVFLLALRNQLVQTSTIAQLPEIWSALSHNFTTDIGLVDLIRYARLAFGMDMANVHARVIGKDATFQPQLESGAYVLLPKGDAVQQIIDSIFTAPSITAQANREAECPAPPPWAQDYLDSLGNEDSGS